MAIHRSPIHWAAAEMIADTKTEVTWVTGGLGSGKTHATVTTFIERCFRNRKCPMSWAVAPTHAKAEDILIPTFTEVLDLHYRLSHGKDYKIRHSKPSTLTFNDTGHTIYFHSALRPELMVGTNISHFMISEAASIKDRTPYEKCMDRLRHPRAQVLQGIIDGVPEGNNDWFSAEANFEGYNHEKKYRRFILWTEENKHLKPDYVERLKRTYSYDPQKLESYLYGRFVPFTRGSAYWDFKHSQNVTLDIAPDPYLPIYLCFDFNKTPIAWVALQRQPFTDRHGNRYFRYVVLAESNGKARGLQDACAEFIAKFPLSKFKDCKVEVYGDCNGYAGSVLAPNCGYDQILQSLRGRYRSVTIEAARSDPGIQSRLERVNAFLVFEQLIVAAWCRNTIRSFEQTNLKDGMWKIDKPSGEDWSHWGDALGYYIHQATRFEDLEDLRKVKIYGIPE